ncbi:SBBP repeat-containing protein [Paracrocinitomix mangrovi]|uniref:SBBP repeat-containing protein n=1 Tax=Paracrocinitomix mangrovi TaxID=2862509 RepID=UPI001C8D5906|nr:SBBP repeat-containing protein [Paracrocinitomix mangrovi]UKN01562.1 SBBP repeat-containing protein [Paracrocinitomix mangrovi]
MSKKIALISFFLYINLISIAQGWEWVRQISGTANDTGHSIDVDNEGNVFVAGRCKWLTTFEDETNPIGPLSIADRDVFVSKYNFQGDLLWAVVAGSEEIGYDLAQCIKADNQGGCYITGIHRNNAIFGNDTIPSQGERDIFVSRIDQNGNFLWTSSIGGPSNDHGFAVETDHNGDVLIGGYLVGPAIASDTIVGYTGQQNGYVAKYDQNTGDLLDIHVIYSQYRTQVRQIVTDDSGNIFFCGGVNGNGVFNGTTFIASNSAAWDDALLVKCDSNLIVDWYQTGGSAKKDLGYDLAVSKNNVYMTGMFTGTATFDTISVTFNSNATTTAEINAAADIFIAAYTQDGDIKWMVTGGGDSLDEGYGIAVSEKEHIYFSGFFDSTITIVDTTLYSTAYSTNMIVGRLDSMGQRVWVHQTGNNAINWARELEIDQHENIFVAGAFYQDLDFGVITHIPQNRDAYGGKFIQSPELGVQILDSAICIGDTLILEFNALTSPVNFQYSELSGFNSWTDSNLVYIIPNSTGNVNISGKMTSSNALFSDSLLVNYNFDIGDIPNPQLINDTIICDTTFIVLSTDLGYSTYNWSNGVSDTNTITVTTNGIYSITVSNQSGCIGSNSVNVTFDDCMGVDDIKSSDYIYIYEGVIYNNSGKNISNIVIYNLAGQVVQSIDMIQQSQNHPLGKLPNGIYLIQYEINNQFVSKKFSAN